MDWNIPGIRAEERIEELHTFLQNFPESRLVPAVKEEIGMLEKLLTIKD